MLVLEFGPNGSQANPTRALLRQRHVHQPAQRGLPRVVGAVTQGHPPIRPFKVKIVNRDHPITQDVDDFVVTNEQHYMVCQNDPKYLLLLQSVNEDGLTYKNLSNSSSAGWAYDYGKGRVCYLAPGHMAVDIWNLEYEKLQKKPSDGCFERMSSRGRTAVGARAPSATIRPHGTCPAHPG
jgi:hypothetical protein